MKIDKKVKMYVRGRLEGRQKYTREELCASVCFVLPSLIGVSIFVVVPFVDVIRRSFFGAMNGVFVGVDNYRTIFTNTAFKLATRNTLKFMGVCIPLLVVISLVLALSILYLDEHMEWFKMAFLLPMAIPVASVVFLWQVLFHEQGLLSDFVVHLGGNSMEWMRTDWAFWILVGSYLWRNVGYDMILWVAGLNTISKGLYEAARVDGASGWQSFIYITVPQLLPTLFTIVVLSILNAFKVFREAYLVAGDYPHESMYMLQHLFNNWFTALDMDKLAAAATLIGGCIFILILGLKRAWEGE